MTTKLLGGASPIKSIQRGFATFNNSGIYVNITTVNPDKAFLTTTQDAFTAEITVDGTQLHFDWENTSTVTTSWQVIEYN